MSVLISDPQRKKERSDVANNQKEIYVAGLARSVGDEDVRKLFAPVRDLSLEMKRSPLINATTVRIVEGRARYEG